MKLLEKADSFLIGAKIRVDSFLNHEEGDTNFISILVLLGIALALAGVFLGFKDQVLAWVDTYVGDFLTRMVEEVKRKRRKPAAETSRFSLYPLK